MKIKIFNILIFPIAINMIINGLGMKERTIIFVREILRRQSHRTFVGKGNIARTPMAMIAWAEYWTNYLLKG